MNAFSQQLLQWFDHSGRHDLPWQDNQNSYRVWVSEIMLQQTQVRTVIPYYERFMASFPTLRSLAEAEQDAVLAHWSGLGYYARGRNLHKAAQIIQQQYGGEFPTEFEQVLALPGIGRSTAGAILSMAQKQRFAILDGNVKRVLTRFLAIEGWPGNKVVENQLWKVAEAFTPQQRFDDYTQAIMDLGATLCTRSKPRCEECPVQSHCQAYKLERVKAFPYSKPKKSKPIRRAKLLMLLNSKQQVWLEQRPQTGIWGGLWSLPQFENWAELEASLYPSTKTVRESVDSLVKWQEFRHTFSHYHLDIEPVKMVQEPPAEWQGRWYTFTQAQQVGLPAPVKSLLTQLENEYVKNG